jgi:carboxyl-terminal processing protease
VGAATHGKPVGSNTWTHCGNAITPITFRTLNAKGMGNYFDGLPVVCEVADDLEHPLGHIDEARLGAAMEWLETGDCTEQASHQRLLSEPSTRRAERLVTRNESDAFGWF